MRKKVYIAAGYTTTFFGPGRKEFDPKQEMPSFETYLKETAEGTCGQLQQIDFDEGFIGSFMSPRFLKQANIPGFLPFMVPELNGKPCTGVEGACGTGGRTLAAAINSILSDQSDATFVAAYEIQNCVKSVYGADILAGASYYKGMRKEGYAHFFPGVFDKRAEAYLNQNDRDLTWNAMAKWYEQAIVNARKNPKAQEFHNTKQNLFELGLTSPNPKKFLPHLNPYHCSKITDGAASLGVFSEEGLKKCGIDRSQAVEVVSMGATQGDITKEPFDQAFLSQSAKAAKNALESAKLSVKEMGIVEVHDCFAITGLLALEAIGLAPKGGAPKLIMEGTFSKEGKVPTNLSGGLIGFGHPTGASGVRMMVDLQRQLTGQADNQYQTSNPYGLMLSMGGNDITSTCIIVKPV